MKLDAHATPESFALPSLLDCMHCGLCLQSCPTYLVTGSETDSPRGRLALMRAAGEGRISDAEIAAPLARCVQCRACEPACPSSVPYHQLLSAHQERQADPRLRRRLATWLGSRRRQCLAALAARLARRSGLLSLVQHFGPRTLRRLAAAVPARPRAFRIRTPSSYPAVGEVRGRVSLHLGCVDPHFYGDVLKHSIAVLNLEGFQVEIPAQPACCGALEAHAGAGEAGRSRGQETLEALRGTDAILVAAAGCTAFLHGFESQAEVSDPLQFLAARGLRSTLSPLPQRIAFDPPCHQQNVLRSEDATFKLLRTIPQLELVPHQEADICCGAGGISFLREPQLTAEVGARKAALLLDAAPQRIASGNPGCRMQIEASLRDAGSRIPVVHPISLLYEAMRRGTYNKP